MNPEAVQRHSELCLSVAILSMLMLAAAAVCNVVIVFVASTAVVVTVVAAVVTVTCVVDFEVQQAVRLYLKKQPTRVCVFAHV